MVHIKDGYNALIFDNSLYTQDDIIITHFTPCYVCICATLSVEGENDKIIVTDFDPDNPDVQFQGISATNKVRIWCATTDSKYVPIKYESTKAEMLDHPYEYTFGDIASHLNRKLPLPIRKVYIA